MSNYSYIIGGRSTGKTRKLLEHAKENNALVICRNPAAMARKAEAYGIFGLKFWGYDETVEYYCEEIYPESDFVIDEVKDFMDYLFAEKCVGFTQTEDD